MTKFSEKCFRLTEKIKEETLEYNISNFVL